MALTSAAILEPPRQHPQPTPIVVPTSGSSVLFPVTFRTSDAYAVTKVKIYSTFSVHLKVRTLQSTAVLLFIGSGGHADRDFLSVELVAGRPRYVFDTGSGPRQVTSSVPINDGRWHDVGIVRSDLSDERGHWLVVDGQVTYDQQAQSGVSKQRQSIHFDLNDELFVGGVSRLMHRQAARTSLKSRTGLHGCLASLVVNGQLRNIADLTSFDVPDDSYGHVVAGCDGPSTECTRAVICENEGECVQQWNSFICTCDMTSFTGPTCNEESIAYTFGHHGGQIAYSFPDHELPDTRHDQLALGIVTSQRAAILVRVTSGSSSDFIEIELVDGSVVVAYNVGLTDHTISDPYVKVNDGAYHVIRFTRTGANATLRIDDLPQQVKIPTGQQRTTFNHQSKVHIGGKPDTAAAVAAGPVPTRHFRGTMAGLVFNGIHILTLASERDPLVNIKGDVDLEVRPLKPPQLQKTVSPPNRRIPITPGTKPTPALEVLRKTSTIDCTSSGSCSNSVTSALPAINGTLRLSDAVTTTSGEATTAAVSRLGCVPDNDDEDCSDDVSSGASAPPDRDRSTLETQQRDGNASPNPFPATDSSTVHPSSAARGASSKRSGIETESGDEPSSSPSAGRRSVVQGSASEIAGGPLVVNVGLVIGVTAGVFVTLLIIAYAVYKYRSRDEGSYSLDPDARNGYAAYRQSTAGSGGVADTVVTPIDDCFDIDDSCGANNSRAESANAGCGAGSTINRLRSSFRSRPKGRRDAKEWYV